MKFVTLFLCFSSASFAIMAAIDFWLGEKAEYLNAFSVLQRIVGIEPWAGSSQVAQQFGALGEFAIVVVANCLMGLIVTGLYKWLIT